MCGLPVILGFITPAHRYRLLTKWTEKLSWDLVTDLKPNPTQWVDPWLGWLEIYARLGFKKREENDLA
jgi:hypothetical protein